MGGGTIAADKRARRHGRRRHKPMSEINVTPFVDVVLVLLVIFIVAAPLLTVGVPVRLPETAATALPFDQEEPLTISISSDGAIALQSEQVPMEELIPRMREIITQRKSDRIFIRGDRELKYEIVMQIMGALNNAGFRNIGLVTAGGGPELDETAE